MLAFRYGHPRTGADVEIRQAVRVPQGPALRSQDRRTARVGVLGRDAERDAAAPALGCTQVGEAPSLIALDHALEAPAARLPPQRTQIPGIRPWSSADGMNAPLTVFNRCCPHSTRTEATAAAGVMLPRFGSRGLATLDRYVHEDLTHVNEAGVDSACARVDVPE